MALRTDCQAFENGPITDGQTGVGVDWGVSVGIEVAVGEGDGGCGVSVGAEV